MSVNTAGKNILIISGGLEALPIIEKAREMGLRVVVSDGDENAPGFALGDETIHASTYDIEETLRQARISHEKTPIDGVISAAADVPKTVAAVAADLGLPGPSLESARLAGDKFLMKKAFREMGVPLPWFSLVDGAQELEGLLEQREKTLVLKPVDSRGARGVLRLTKDVDVSWAFSEALKNSPSGRVMAEEWVDGEQLSTESVVAGGRVATPGLSERNYEYLERFAPFVIENGGDLPARHFSGELEAIDRVITDVARAFGIKDWTIKGDIVMTGSGPVLIEAAPRLSGGYFCTHTIPLSTGVDIVEGAILLALGVRVNVDDYRPVIKNHVSQRFWFPKAGVVRKIRRAPDLKTMPGLAMMRLHVSRGERLTSVVSHPGRAGMVITTGATREEAATRAREAISSVEIITEKPLKMAQ
ncbi:MAG: ATP-grasp domain-containing protein [Thermodesulfobacteriota bacterium]